MTTNCRLELSDDTDRNIWAYFSIMKVTYVVMDDILLLILSISLIDRSLEMDLYKIHNCPTLHLDLGVQFSYIIGQHLDISKHGIHTAILTEHDIRICMATEGYLCMLKQVPYPVETLRWCVYALYISDRERIYKHCLVDSKIWHAYMAVGLDDYLWSISSLVNH